MSDESPLTAQVSHALQDAMADYFEANDFQPFDPNDCKMLARFLRDRLMERFEIRPAQIDGRGQAPSSLPGHEQSDGPKRPPALSPEERKKRADSRDRGELNDGTGSGP